MKSQDILLLFKIVSLEQQARSNLKRHFEAHALSQDTSYGATLPGQNLTSSIIDLTNAEFAGWDDLDLIHTSDGHSKDLYSVRSLSESLGVGKTEIGTALNRCRDIGLLHESLQTGLPVVNRKALVGLVTNAIKYIFPVKPGLIVRGIPTAFAAPVLAGKLMSSGELVPVWPDAYGKTKGQSIEPLFRSVPGAVKKDMLLYHYLALVDAIRIGGARETEVASKMLNKWVLDE
jgi:hypothetical protein